MSNKERELNFIKGYSSISINKICKNLGINRSNLVHGKITYKKLHLVYILLVEEITKMINDVIKYE